MRQQVEPAAKRVNLTLPDDLYNSLLAIVSEKGYRSPTEVIQAALRMLLLAHKYEADPQDGLFWKKGDACSKVIIM